MNIVELLKLLNNNDAIIQLITSFVGVGGALWVFYLTIKKAKKKEDEDKNRFEVDKIRYAYHLMKGSEDFADQFRKDLAQFCRKFSANPFQVPEFSKPVQYTIKRFVEKINQEEHFHAYKNQIPFGTSITSIFNNIDYIDALFTNIYEQYKETLLRHIEKGIQCTSMLNDCTFMIVNDFNVLKGYEDKSSEILTLMNIYEDAKNNFLKINKKGDLRLIQSAFIIPLSKGIFDYRKQTGDSSFENTFKKLAAANQILVSIEMNNLNSIKSFHSELNNLNKVYFRLLQNMQSVETFIVSS